jgi:hypothetical protein
MDFIPTQRGYEARLLGSPKSHLAQLEREATTHTVYTSAAGQRLLMVDHGVSRAAMAQCGASITAVLHMSRRGHICPTRHKHMHQRWAENRAVPTTTGEWRGNYG